MKMSAGGRRTLKKNGDSSIERKYKTAVIVVIIFIIYAIFTIWASTYLNNMIFKTTETSYKSLTKYAHASAAIFTAIIIIAGIYTAKRKT